MTGMFCCWLAAVSVGCQFDTRGTRPSSAVEGQMGVGGSVSGANDAVGANAASGGTDSATVDTPNSFGGDLAQTGTRPSSGGMGQSDTGGQPDTGGANNAAGTSGIGGNVSTAGGESSTGGTAGGNSAGTGETAGSCPTGANPCVSIPQFTANAVVDGQGDEYCGVPSFELNFTDASRVVEYNGTFGRTHYPERALARVAWSTNYVHAFVRVIDPFVAEAESLDYIWGADSIELMISANRSVTGSSANDSSTLRVVAAPWKSSALGMAASVLTSGTSSAYTQLPDGQYAVVVDAQGYSVELKVPWPNHLTVSASSKVMFDFALNSAVADVTAGGNVRDAQATFYLGAVMGSSPCGMNILPYCDDRTWCASNLD